jgi:3-hydroxypropionyl-CoA synthetase (ADP-forming)
VEGYLGILAEEQAPPGVELIVGLQNDETFGPLLMVGLGGILTDLFRDVTFGMLPLTEGDIRGMLRSLRGYPLLAGYRGSEPVNENLLVRALQNIAAFGHEFADLYDSVDFNPVIARPDGCTVVDAKLIFPGEEKRYPASEAPRAEHLQNFFTPKSVALIGASTTEGKIGNVILDTLTRLEFRGTVYPINPNYETIMGLQTHASLKDLPERPDLVVIVVDLSLVPGILDEMNEIGAPAALIVSGGGKELGGERAALEETIRASAREKGIRIIGPNCIGSFDGHSRFDSFFYHQDRFQRPGPGSMSFITQSGTWGCAFMEKAHLAGVSRMVSYGNRVDVDEGDLISFFADDDQTSVIGSYIEGLGDGRKFIQASRRAIDAGKPVLVYKTGRSLEAAKASVSHTGAYGGSYHVYEGVFRQAGIITTDSFYECYAGCQALAMQPKARGNRVALLSNGAGPMVNALDHFTEKGLALASLTGGSKSDMKDHFSFFYIVDNPVDVTGSASAEDYEYVIERLLDDGNVDIIMVFFVFQNTPLDESIVERMARLNEKKKKPILCCAAGGPYTEKMSTRLVKEGIPVFDDIIQWVSAASAMARWSEIMKGEK